MSTEREVVVDDEVALVEFHDALGGAVGHELGCCQARRGYGVGCRIIGAAYPGLGPGFFDQLCGDRPDTFGEIGPSPLADVMAVVLDHEERRRWLQAFARIPRRD